MSGQLQSFIRMRIWLPFLTCAILALLKTASGAEPVALYEEHSNYQKGDVPAILECYHFAIANNKAVQNCAILTRIHKRCREAAKKCELDKTRSWMDIKGYEATGKQRGGQTCVNVRPSGEILKERERIATARDVALAWESRVRRKHRSKSQTLFGIISRDYREAKDEFKRNEMSKQLASELKIEMRQARGKGGIVVSMDVRLDEYDFQRKGFPARLWGLLQQAAIIYSAEAGEYAHEHYRVEFTNPRAASFVRVDEEIAREVTSVLQTNHRQAELVLHCDIVRARVHQDRYSFHAYKQLTVKAKKTELNIVKRDHAGRLLFHKKIKRLGG